MPRLGTDKPASTLLFLNMTVLQKPRVISRSKTTSLALFSLLVFSLGIIPFQNSVAAEGAFGSSRILEPRLRKQKEEEARAERERKRKAIEERNNAAKNARRSFYYGEKEQEKSREELEFEENKEYMSYWQRLKHSWKYADSFQDVFDQSLSTTYVPAKVTGSFLNIHSGPGRNYPTIYIAEKEELINFTAIRTEWYQIRTPDDHFGWVHMNDLPNNTAFEEEQFGFSDQAKEVAARKNPIDIGFSGGFLSDQPVMSFFAKRRATHFLSTEVEYGFSRDPSSDLSFASFNVLAHPFTEYRYQPHFLLGIGQMSTEAGDPNSTGIFSESGLMTKAGLGLSRKLSRRLRFRADLSQYTVDINAEELNHHTALTIGSSFVWGSSTDKIFNRAIEERVKITDTEISIFGGSINLSNGPSASISGIRGAYHVSEDHFFELSYAQGSDDYSHFTVAVARNLLPSEFVINWRKKRNFWPTQLYGLVGSGLQTIDENEQISLVGGLGIRLNPLRRFAIRVDLRNALVEQQTINGNSNGKFLKNPELSFGLSGYF